MRLCNDNVVFIVVSTQQRFNFRCVFVHCYHHHHHVAMLLSIKIVQLFKRIAFTLGFFHISRSDDTIFGYHFLLAWRSFKLGFQFLAYHILYAAQMYVIRLNLMYY